MYAIACARLLGGGSGRSGGGFGFLFFFLGGLLGGLLDYLGAVGSGGLFFLDSLFLFIDRFLFFHGLGDALGGIGGGRCRGVGGGKGDTTGDQGSKEDFGDFHFWFPG